MPVEAKPLFRPEVLRPHLAAFRPGVEGGPARAALKMWAGLLGSAQADSLHEQELLPDFLPDIFCGLLGYTRAVDSKDRYTFTREKHVAVDGKYADAVLGDFRPGQDRFTVAVEGKGPKDPFDRPHAGRKMSAVDQGYRYSSTCRRMPISPASPLMNEGTAVAIPDFQAACCPFWKPSLTAKLTRCGM